MRSKTDFCGSDFNVYALRSGGFVAWSWSSIKGFDEGEGIILSATWLLPMVLIPGSWEDPDMLVSPGTDDAPPPPPEK